jgi:hypothetical protein
LLISVRHSHLIEGTEKDGYFGSEGEMWIQEKRNIGRKLAHILLENLYSTDIKQVVQYSI